MKIYFPKIFTNRKGKANAVVLVIIFTLMIGCSVMSFLFIREARQKSDSDKDRDRDEEIGCSYNGESYQDGDKFEATDGCNSCFCENGEVACTQMACVEDEGVEQTTFELIGDSSGLVKSLSFTLRLPDSAVFDDSDNTVTGENTTPAVVISDESYSLTFKLMHDTEIIKYDEVELNAVENIQLGDIDRFKAGDVFGYSNKIVEGENCDSYGGEIIYPCGSQEIVDGEMRFLVTCQASEDYVYQCDEVLEGMSVELVD